MNGKEYEDFVERVITEIDFWSGAKVFRNKKYSGVRQAGEYEIDIAFELNLTDLIFFRLIIECKYHIRPITRPVVQQLAQTRDAICAHKAAIASPIGFSSEAIDVAKDLGVALWIVAIDKPVITVMSCEGGQNKMLSEIFLALRTDYLKIFGINSTIEKTKGSHIVHFCANPPKIDMPMSYGFTVFKPTDDLSRPIQSSDFSNMNNANNHGAGQTYIYSRPISTGSAFFSYKNHHLFDDNCALKQIIRWVFEEHGDRLIEFHKSAIEDWEQNILHSPKYKEFNTEIIEYIKEGEQEEFLSYFKANGKK